METDEADRPRAVEALSAPGLAIGADLTSPTIAMRLDEAASFIHAQAAAKAAIYLPAGAMAALLLPATLSVGWLAGGMILEAWSWLATRAQARLQPVRRRTRASFAANFVVSNAWWLLLIGLCWLSGPVGEMCAVALVLALGSVSVLLFRNSPLTLMVAGMAPATGVLTMLALADGRSWSQLIPVWIALGLAAAFKLSVARGTPSTQEQRRLVNDSLSKYKLLADNVTDIIARTDLAGIYQYISPASLSVLGYRPEQMVGTPLQQWLHPESEPEIAAALGRMIDAPDRAEVVTLRTRHTDGRWLWLQTNVKLICEEGVPVGAIGVSRDITQAVLADIALQEAKTEAEAANRAKADFLANVSHEIRTPMNAILGALHLLEKEDVSQEGRELMHRASDCGRMLSQLLNDVLDFSKIESGQLELAPEPMNAGEALQSVAALLDGQARASGIELRCELPEGDLWIEADPVRLRQAMFNLIGNAVKFTAQGHVIARLKVSAPADGRRHVRLEVEDTGIGMTLEAQRHLFERFRQAESTTTRRFGGTGLGLSITKALADLMGGEIGFTSVAGQGSTFWLAFDAPAAASSADPTDVEGMLDGVNVLLVEDNATNRLVARIMLARLGANIEEAEDGVVGVAAARRGACDLILMDIQMPHMDGVAATRAIRDLPGPVSQVPIIALTANVMAHQRAQYLAAGMNGVVAKPISAAALLGEIAQVFADQDAPPSQGGAGSRHAVTTG